MDHVEGESRLLVQEIMDLVNKEFTKKNVIYHPMEMITCQDLAKILQKMIDISHPIEMMPYQDLVTYFQKKYMYMSPNEKYVEMMSWQDLADHGPLGRPYEIVVDEMVGRHLVAVRDVKAGEVGKYNMSNNNMGKYSMSNNNMSNMAVEYVMFEYHLRLSVDNGGFGICNVSIIFS